MPFCYLQKGYMTYCIWPNSSGLDFRFDTLTGRVTSETFTTNLKGKCIQELWYSVMDHQVVMPRFPVVSDLSPCQAILLSSHSHSLTLNIFPFQWSRMQTRFKSHSVSLTVTGTNPLCNASNMKENRRQDHTYVSSSSVNIDVQTLVICRSVCGTLFIESL